MVAVGTRGVVEEEMNDLGLRKVRAGVVVAAGVAMVLGPGHGLLKLGAGGQADLGHHLFVL